ncbi:MAG: hypothetical protein WD733_04390 [Bryobacterales bacterium]
MKLLTLMLLCPLAFAQSPVERFPWRADNYLAQAQAQAQEYETYRKPWVEYRTKVDTFQRSRRWQRLFVATSFAAIGSALIYSQSRANSPSAGSTRAISLGVSGGLLAFEFLTNREGRRDKDYSLLNLGLTGSFAALTVHDQLRD